MTTGRRRPIRAARLRASTFAPDTQSCAQIDLGELLGLEIVEERLERFHAGGRVAHGIGQIILIALDLELGDLGDRPFGTDMSDEAVDLAGCQLTLTGGEIAEISRGDLAQAFCVDFLYGNTSSWEPTATPGVWLNYTDAIVQTSEPGPGLARERAPRRRRAAEHRITRCSTGQT